MRAKNIIIAAVLAVVVIGGGAFAFANLAGNAPQPAPTSTAPTAAPGDEHEHELVPSPTTTPDLEGAAVAATDALEAYARRDLGYTEWFAQLEPHLHESAVEAYATVQPSNIPEIVVDGPAVTAETSSDTYAVVYVPTSIGEFIVELRRDDSAANWGATRFQPPA